MSDYDFVNFKVYLKGKGSGQEEVPEIRRFNVAGDAGTSLAYLEEKIVSLFPGLRRDHFNLTWTDSDGDQVLIGSDDELLIAFDEMGGPVYKLNVNARAKKTNHDHDAKGELHVGVFCDGCHGDIRGFRYKCAVCPDFDLCRKCEVKGMHPDHNMMRISTPKNAWPGHLFRRLSKMHERTNKRASCHEDLHMMAHEAAHQRAYNGNFEPIVNGGHRFNGKARMPTQEITRGANGLRGGRGGQCGMRGGGYLWKSMIQGWRGEDEIIDTATHTTKDKSENVTDEISAAGDKHQETASVSGGNAFDEYLRNVGSMVAAALDPLGVDVLIDIEHNGNRPNISKPEEKLQEESVKKSAEMEETEKATVDDVQSVSKEPVVLHDLLTYESDKESCSDDDEWTVLKYDTPTKEVVNIPINLDQVEKKVQELAKNTEDVDETVTVETVEVPMSVNVQPPKKIFLATPDGTIYSDLPKEMSMNEEKKVFFATPDGTIYSELPKEKPAVKEEEQKPVASPANVTASHSDPRIQVALQAMLNMGFTNEDGWLAQLLEAKKGDIGRALDVLLPVKPVRK